MRKRSRGGGLLFFIQLRPSVRTSNLLTSLAFFFVGYCHNICTSPANIAAHNIRTSPASIAAIAAATA